MRPPALLLRSLLARPSTSTWRLPASQRPVARACPRARCLPAAARHASAAAKPPAASSHPTQSTSSATTAPASRLERDQVPAYELTFTCKICTTRSSHRLSKQGYHHGTILISCPGCQNRHLISDHLKIFSDKSVTIEDLIKEKGSLVRRGSLHVDGDVEFWDDGSTTARSANFSPPSTTSEPDNPKLTEPPESQHVTETDAERRASKP
ncbi:DNL zinc finger-domain-containing protein [Massariosphaeria phaeospora]|uniref:DNL zinc finger-domain-containing protein n=1 Tax=Massariosphaeria phaeospora TaxID=100035 RepID=A0A7C8ING4_9PLEO|nr:DNL zinc finger-domain-containing protein [Massariosphaeria phaeospora]